MGSGIFYTSSLDTLVKTVHNLQGLARSSIQLRAFLLKVLIFSLMGSSICDTPFIAIPTTTRLMYAIFSSRMAWNQLHYAPRLYGAGSLMQWRSHFHAGKVLCQIIASSRRRSWTDSCLKVAVPPSGVPASTYTSMIACSGPVFLRTFPEDGGPSLNGCLSNY